MMSGIILMGMPGAGKSTIGEYLCSKYGYSHLSSQDVLWDEIRHNTVIGICIKNTLDVGAQISDTLIARLVLTRLEEFAQSNQSFILDGFPKTTNQLNALHEFTNRHPSLSLRYFSVLVDKDTALKRMFNRMTCAKCHRIYNKSFFKNEQEPSCCFSPLKIRSSDRDERANQRIETFTKTTEKVIQNDLKCVYSIDSNLTIEEVKTSIDTFFREII